MLFLDAGYVGHLAGAISQARIKVSVFVRPLNCKE